MSSEAQQIKAERDALKKRYLGLYGRVSSILFSIDPIGINFEDNTDEYDPETDTILPRLSNCNSSDDVRKVVIEEFQRWFDSDMVNSGNQRHYDEIASAIWGELQIFRGANLLTTNTEQDAAPAVGATGAGKLGCSLQPRRHDSSRF